MRWINFDYAHTSMFSGFIICVFSLFLNAVFFWKRIYVLFFILLYLIDSNIQSKLEFHIILTIHLLNDRALFCFFVAWNEMKSIILNGLHSYETSKNQQFMFHVIS